MRTLITLAAGLAMLTATPLLAQMPQDAPQRGAQRETMRDTMRGGAMTRHKKGKQWPKQPAHRRNPEDQGRTRPDRGLKADLRHETQGDSGHRKRQPAKRSP